MISEKPTRIWVRYNPGSPRSTEAYITEQQYRKALEDGEDIWILGPIENFHVNVDTMRFFSRNGYGCTWDWLNARFRRNDRFMWRFVRSDWGLGSYGDILPVPTHTEPEGTVNEKQKYRSEKWGNSTRIYQGDRFVCTFSNKDKELADAITRVINDNR